MSDLPVGQHAEICNPLMVLDLLYTILDCFRPVSSLLERRALAALAQTCRAFSEPSLDRLWQSLHSLEPLILCYTTVDGVRNMIPPTTSQFAIIDRYSRRIRKLTISDSSSLRFLHCMNMRPSCLLPNLMVLRWNPFDMPPQIPIIFIQRLLSPTLVSLEAGLTEGDGATLLSFLDNYPHLCRNLKSVKFRFAAGVYSATTIQALSRSICMQKALENVILHAPIDDIALRHLSTLSTLKVLNVKLSERSRPQTHSFLPTGPLFHNAEELVFETPDFDLVTSLLRPSDQVFHTLRVFYHNRLTSEVVLTFLNVLSSRPCTKPLKELSLSSANFSRPLSLDQMAGEGPHYRLSYEILRPLMVFRSLHVLVIEWGEQVSLDDDEVTNLARSWPLLQVFNLYCGRGGYTPPATKYPTLLGLLSLIASCPQLQTVSLPLDATRVPDVPEVPTYETNFACLIVPESPIKQARPVAEFLFKYLPRVTSVDARFLLSPGPNIPQIIAYEQAWGEVEIYLDELHGS